MSCTNYTSLAKYIPNCLTTLNFSVPVNGNYSVVIQDKFGHKYTWDGAIYSQVISIDLADEDIPESLITEYSGQFGVLIYVDGELYTFTCNGTTYNSIVIQAQKKFPSENTFTIDLNDCNGGEFDSSFNFDFNV